MSLVLWPSWLSSSSAASCCWTLSGAVAGGNRRDLRALLNSTNSSFPELDGLRIAPTGALLLHETHDLERLDRLRGRMASERVQGNPVICAPADSGYLVLDGAHRVRALRELGYPLALVQVVDLPPVAQGWQHHLPLPDLDALHRVDGLSLNVFSPDEDPPPGDSPEPVAEVEDAKGARVVVSPPVEGLQAKVEALWSLRALYGEEVEEGEAVEPVSRVEPGEVVTLSEGEVVVRYRSFPTPDLVEATAGGTVLPAGVTRFRVPRRILGVRLPLSLLSAEDAGSANRKLRALTRRRLEENRVRRYDEPVLLFE